MLFGERMPEGCKAEEVVDEIRKRVAG